MKNTSELKINSEVFYLNLANIGLRQRPSGEFNR